jgi:hypothetical protein
VKKVHHLTTSLRHMRGIAVLIWATVERSRALGLGHCRRQLRHLQKPHHGPVYRLPGQPGECYE